MPKGKNNTCVWTCTWSFVLPVVFLLLVIVAVYITTRYFIRREAFANARNASTKTLLAKMMKDKGFASSEMEAMNVINKMLVIEQSEFFNELGIDFKKIPDNVKSQFVKFDLHETLAVMKQNVVIGEFGEEIGLNELVVPAAYLNVMRKKLQQPENIRLENTFAANEDEKSIYPYKKCIVGNVTYKTNILNTQPNDLGALADDAEALRNKKKTYGCIIEFQSTEQFKRDLINVYLYSDNQNMVKVREMMKEFKRTNDERENALGLFVESDKTNKEWTVKRDTSLRDLALDNARYRDQLKSSEIAANRLRESTANLNDATNRWWMNQNYGYKPVS